MSEHHPVPDDPLDPTLSTEMTIRRAPKVWPFLATGAVLGVLAAIALVMISGTSENYTTGGTIGYFAIIFGILGVGIAGVAYLLVDRRSLKKATRATAYPYQGEPESVKE